MLRFSRVLIPITGSRVDNDIIKLACELAKRPKGKVFVAYVIQVRRTLPLEAEIESEIKKGEDFLEKAEIVAEQQDYEVETDLLQAREIGPAIVDEAVEKGVDIIMMGMAYKKRFGEFSLGSVVPYVLKNAPCPVLLLRETMVGEV